jgi:lipid A 4'-phosphatase
MNAMMGAKLRAEFRTPRIGLALQVLIAALAIGTIAGFLFYLFPEIDLNASALFYDGTAFSGLRTPTIGFIRTILLNTNIVIYATALSGLVLAVTLKRSILHVSAPKWFFVLVCLIAGPGFVANTIFKDNWGRARPSHVVEFGGTKAYSAAAMPSDQCERNCSFVAGEASTFYVAFFAAAFVFPAFAGRLIAAGIGAGTLAGLVRMSQGAHFLSDVVFAGVAMAAVVALIQLIFQAVEHNSARQRAEAAGTRTRS